MNIDIRLALLFLVVEPDLRQPQAWREFIEAARGKAFVFCHPKLALNPESILSGYEIDENYMTEWGGIGITQAMFALLRAAASDSQITHFLFASESCAPIKPWSFLEHVLATDPRSRIYWKHWHEMSKDHQVRRHSTQISKSFWRHHPQWVLLNRDTAEFLLGYSETLTAFTHSRCSDEHAIGTILAIHGYNMDKVIRMRTTWTEWRRKMHPETLHFPTPRLWEEWRLFDGFLARKFSRNWRNEPWRSE